MKQPPLPRGFALLLVMWALFIMSFSIIGLLTLLNIDVGNATAMEKVAVASSLAFSGVTLGRQEAFPTTGQIEKMSFADGSEIEVRAVSENSKLQINLLLAAANDETLLNLFRLWGLTDVEADTVRDCLADYIEPGSTRRLNGAKEEQYRLAGRRPPTGKPFQSVKEMSHVLHFDLVTHRKPDWQNYFTIYGDGSLDLTTASPDVLRAVCGLGDASAKAVQQGSPNFGDLDAARLAMGLTEKEFDKLRHRVMLGGKVRRIESTGTFAQVKRHIEAIYQVDGSTASVLEWREW